jgi:hypothetical protein
MPTKLETHLSPEQLLEFFRRCAQTRGGTTLRTIQAIAEEFGVTISLMSASATRDGPLQQYLESIRAARESTEAIVTIAKEGLGVTDAAAAVLGRTLLDKSLALARQGEDASLDETDAMTKSLKRLRDGDQRGRFFDANMKIQQFDAAKAALMHASELREISNDTKLSTAEKLERARKKLFGDAPADVQTLDQLDQRPNRGGDKPKEDRA